MTWLPNRAEDPSEVWDFKRVGAPIAVGVRLPSPAFYSPNVLVEKMESWNNPGHGSATELQEKARTGIVWECCQELLKSFVTGSRIEKGRNETGRERNGWDSWVQKRRAARMMSGQRMESSSWQFQGLFSSKRLKGSMFSLWEWLAMSVKGTSLLVWDDCICLNTETL